MKPLSLSDVAIQLGLSAQRVRQLIHSGELPAFCPGGSRWRVTPEALRAFIDSRSNSSPAAASGSDSEVKS